MKNSFSISLLFWLLFLILFNCSSARESISKTQFGKYHFRNEKNDKVDLADYSDKFILVISPYYRNGSYNESLPKSIQKLQMENTISNLEIITIIQQEQPRRNDDEKKEIPKPLAKEWKEKFNLKNAWDDTEENFDKIFDSGRYQNYILIYPKFTGYKTVNGIYEPKYYLKYIQKEIETAKTPILFRWEKLQAFQEILQTYSKDIYSLLEEPFEKNQISTSHYDSKLDTKQYAKYIPDLVSLEIKKLLRECFSTNLVDIESSKIIDTEIDFEFWSYEKMLKQKKEKLKEDEEGGGTSTNTTNNKVTRIEYKEGERITTYAEKINLPTLTLLKKFPASSKGDFFAIIQKNPGIRPDYLLAHLQIEYYKCLSFYKLITYYKEKFTEDVTLMKGLIQNLNRCSLIEPESEQIFYTLLSATKESYPTEHKVLSENPNFKPIFEMTLLKFRELEKSISKSKPELYSFLKEKGKSIQEDKDFILYEKQKIPMYLARKKSLEEFTPSYDKKTIWLVDEKTVEKTKKESWEEKKEREEKEAEKLEDLTESKRVIPSQSFLMHTGNYFRNRWGDFWDGIGIKLLSGFGFYLYLGPVELDTKDYLIPSFNSKLSYKNYTKVEAGATILLGVGAKVDPLEILDFSIGLTSLDIYRDDYYGSSRQILDDIEYAVVSKEERIIHPPDASKFAIKPNLFKDGIFLGRDKQTVLNDYNENHTGSETKDLEWLDGSVKYCRAGKVSDSHIQKILQRINFFRRMAGLVTITSAKPKYNFYPQRKALALDANDALNHRPPRNWKCYSPYGQEWSSEIITTAGGAYSVDVFMNDSGDHNKAVGHRRDILYPSLETISIGSTPGGTAMNLREESNEKEITKFIAWPPAGYVTNNTIYSRWSIESNMANSLSKAKVKMKDANGKSIPLKMDFEWDHLLVWVPEIPNVYEIKEDTTYTVEISGIKNESGKDSLVYEVTIFNPKPEKKKKNKG